MTEAGLNVPLICVKIARGEHVDAVSDYPPVGTLFVQPVEESILLGIGVLDWLIYSVRNEDAGHDSDRSDESTATLERHRWIDPRDLFQR